jgi:chromosomal replication initiation ATPase DnaA
VAHRLVHHALSAVTVGGGPGACGAYNPVVIVGPAGSGKSRLLADWFLEHSHGATDDHARAAAVMWDGRSLDRELAAALSQNTIDKLHQRFVAARLIIIDNVEQITAWDAQRMLAHLFDTAVASGTVFVATLRTHPIACTSLEPSLASRLSGGLVVSMPPAATTRCLPDTDTGDQREISLRRVIGATARRHGLTAADLVGPSRCRQVSQARGMAMYLARRLTQKSLQSIGAAFGGRDHTTVLHGIRVTEARRSLDPGVATDIEQLIETLLAR